MAFEIWLAYALACAALLAIPGPTVLLVVSYALGAGRRSGLATVPGVTLGDFTAMTVSLLGAGAVLATSATLFTVLKLAGAGYLVWLGIQLWRAPVSDGASGAAVAASFRRMFWNSWLVTALKPKGMVFFIAFVPQFVDASQPAMTRFVIREATFGGMAMVNAALWALLAGRMRDCFQRPSTRRLVNRIGGSCLIAAGLVTASARRVN
mgnify:CR=1 FL=1